MSTPRPIVHHGDCLAVLRTLPDESVDAVVTDPPYGLSNTDPKHVAETLTKWVTGDHEYTPPAKGGFMGKTWDSFVPPPAVWGECMRVLKPGGHLLVFAGTRTQDLMGLSIRLAGFELRDGIGYGHGMLAWCYGSGFPKSHNVNRDDRFCQCVSGVRDAATEEAAESAAEVLLSDLRRGGKEDALNVEDLHGVPVHVHPAGSVPGGTEQDLFTGVRSGVYLKDEDGAAVPVQHAGDDSVRDVQCRCDALAVEGEAERPDVLLSQVRGAGEGGNVRVGRSSRQSSVDARVCRGCANQDDRGEQPCVEGRGDIQAPEGELRRASLRAVPGGSAVDGTQRRVCNGAPSSDGATDRANATAVGSGAPHQPRSEGQSGGEPGTVPVERGSQAWGGWPVCGGCGKPALPRGLGTALKPAWEPVIMARRPIRGTVAANVLAHGTGGINVDSCRVAGPKPDTTRGASVNRSSMEGGPLGRQGRIIDDGKGRFPPNVLLDPEAAAAMDEQSGMALPKKARTGRKGGCSDNGTLTGYGSGDDVGTWPADPGGGASRFFPVFKYQAKAPAKERPQYTAEDGRVVKHATVKPLELMRWLVRLVTPAGGVVLDPFAGSGTTGEAAMLEGFDSILIEGEAEHLPLIDVRIDRSADDTTPPAADPEPTPPTLFDRITACTSREELAELYDEVAATDPAAWTDEHTAAGTAHLATIERTTT